MLSSNMADIKKNFNAIRLANRVYFMVREFNKDFLSVMKEEPIEKKLEMYQLCIKYMKETLNKRFK